jgi:hypothetical protein
MIEIHDEKFIAEGIDDASYFIEKYKVTGDAINLDKAALLLKSVKVYLTAKKSVLNYEI